MLGGGGKEKSSCVRNGLEMYDKIWTALCMDEILVL